MTFKSINPATGSIFKEINAWTSPEIEAKLQAADAAQRGWEATPFEYRATLLREVAAILRNRKPTFAQLITAEMGKLIGESQAEIEKCAWACEYYADHGADFLADEIIPSDAAKSFVTYQPLGTVLAIMPWNFPFWQVYRCAAPTLMAGNTLVLKHASNVPQCALAIESIFKDAGFPEGVFQTLLISAEQVGQVIEDSRIHAVTLTGSEAAGRKVAATAGACVKKSVLELGGSDAFIVLEDAEMEQTVRNAVTSRFLNAGQSCIAAKRFIVVNEVADSFVEQLKSAIEGLTPGDPMNETTTLAPMARADLRDTLHEQVQDSIEAGAITVCGCQAETGPGFYYQPSLLDHVIPGMRAFEEELFGPVAAVTRVRDEQHALELANQSRYGLGGSVWTRDIARGENLARQLAVGAGFVNGLVKSDPRLPFGGVKNSGYGRELSHHGIREFVNQKTIWIG